MKILICVPQKEKMQALFEYTVSLMKNLKVKGEVSCSADCELIQKKIEENAYSYDILILDAKDKDHTAIARSLRNRNLISSIIFVADKERKVPNILRYRPSALITALENDKQIRDAIIWTYNEQVKARPYFTIKNKDAIMRINHSDILWFESRQRVVVLHTKKQEISFYAKLSDVYQLLPQESFLRCHQSYIVNCDMISRIDKAGRYICLTTGETIEISKSCYQQVISYAEQGKF